VTVKRRVYVLTAIMGLCGIMAAEHAHATLVRNFTLSAMAYTSDAIIRGEVLDHEVVYDPWWAEVYTHSFVRVDEVLKGANAPGDIIVLRQIGGSLDGVETRVVGTARVETGAEVVLFARCDGFFHYLVGMAQGKYDVVRDGSGETVLRRDTPGLSRMHLPLPSRRPAPDQLTLIRVRALMDDMGVSGGAP